jgi:hypothetical protein
MLFILPHNVIKPFLVSSRTRQRIINQFNSIWETINSFLARWSKKSTTAVGIVHWDFYQKAKFSTS